MTTTKVRIEDTQQPKLTRAVIRQCGRECLEDIARHGANAGYPGLTYYTDTVAFFKANRAEIVERVNRMADEFGETSAEMVAGFQCLAGRSLKRGSYGYMSPEDTRHNKAQLAKWLPAIYVCLGGGRLEGDNVELVANALAWFAAEEVAREMNPDL